MFQSCLFALKSLQLPKHKEGLFYFGAIEAIGVFLELGCYKVITKVGLEGVGVGIGSWVSMHNQERDRAS